jgi:hypothetical protein
MSRLTLIEIGIIADKRRMNLKKLITQVPLNSERATMKKLRATINTNKNLDIRLISRSSFPTLVFAGCEFIYERDSLPVKTIIPSTWPLDANTVFAHIVFSRLNDSL